MYMNFQTYKYNSSFKNYVYGVCLPEEPIIWIKTQYNNYLLITKSVFDRYSQFKQS